MVVLIAFDADSRISLYVFPLWAVLLVIGYQVLKRIRPDAALGAAGERPQAERAR